MGSPAGYLILRQASDDDDDHGDDNDDPASRVSDIKARIRYQGRPLVIFHQN